MVFMVEYPQVDQDEVVGYIAIQKGSATLQDSTTGEPFGILGEFFRRKHPVLCHTYQQHQKGYQMVPFGQVSIHHLS